jgi:hypothetical protein
MSTNVGILGKPVHLDFELGILARRKNAHKNREERRSKRILDNARHRRHILRIRPVRNNSTTALCCKP